MTSRTRKITLAVVAVAALAAASLTCSPGYLIHAGIAEGRILSGRRPIDRVIADPATSPEVRRQLRLVLQARTYAREALGLEVGQSYTTFSRVESDTLAMVLSAARDDAFEQVTWWFPIVGHVPYKGYFGEGKAERAAAELQEDGYDTYVRPTAAFSTLGWFNDPMLSTLLRYDDVQLVATVIHELTHNTLFVPSRVSFNESFASFVGDRGAIAYFCALEGEAGERCRLARDYWADNLVFGGFLQRLVAELDATYRRTDIGRAEKLRLKRRILTDAARRYGESIVPALRTHAFRRYDPARANNASLIARRLYFDRLDRFEAVYAALGGDLPRAVREIRSAVADADDPYAALEALATGATSTP